MTALLLIAIFLAFAALMFLERISALLALPLMAVCFMLVALASDLLAPASTQELISSETTDALGRRQVQVRAEPSRSRFSAWRELKIARQEALAERTAQRGAALRTLEAILADETCDPVASLATALPRLRESELAQATVVAQKLDELAAPLKKTPRFAPGQAAFDETHASLSAVALLRPLVDVSDAALLRQRGAALLRSATLEQSRLAARHVAPAPRGWTSGIRDAASYIFEHLAFVLRSGSLALHAAIIATAFGGMFAMYVRNLKLAERIIYFTAEFAGEQPRVIALLVFVVTAGIFTSVGGLGTVIMLGTIILPVLRSVGLSSVVAAGVFLIAIAAGGTLQPVSRRLWMDFYGVSAAQLDGILWTVVGFYGACGLGWILWGTRRTLLSSFEREAQAAPEVERIPPLLLAAPLIPIALVYLLGVEEITAFVASIVYMFLCVCRRSGATRVLARSLIEGAQAVAPPMLLMLGIGMLITALSTAPVQSYLRPMLAAVVPGTRWGYIMLFALAAPLALYRGPLNVWGMGLAVSATLLATSPLPPAAILCAILAAGMLQGICDPTNTANVWVAGFLGISANQILRYTLWPVWLTAAAAVLLFGFWFVP